MIEKAFPLRKSCFDAVKAARFVFDIDLVVNFKGNIFLGSLVFDGVLSFQNKVIQVKILVVEREVHGLNLREVQHVIYQSE